MVSTLRSPNCAIELEDIASAVLFLTSDAESDMPGTEMAIDVGRTEFWGSVAGHDHLRN